MSVKNVEYYINTKYKQIKYIYVQKIVSLLHHKNALVCWQAELNLGCMSSWDKIWRLFFLSTTQVLLFMNFYMWRLNSVKHCNLISLSKVLIFGCGSCQRHLLIFTGFWLCSFNCGELDKYVTDCGLSTIYTDLSSRLFEIKGKWAPLCTFWHR